MAAQQLKAHEPGSVVCSATTGEGLEDLLEVVGSHLRRLTRTVDLLIPFDRGDIMAQVHREGEVVEETNSEQGWLIRARFEEASVGRLEEFIDPGAKTNL